MNRRKFLSGSLAAGAAAAASGLRFGRGGRGILRQAQAAVPPGLLATPYPTVVIMLHGGIDPGMHLLPLPNGKHGNLTFVNRMNGTSGIKEISSGLRYFTGTIAAPGKADFEPHLPDIAMLRALHGARAHESVAMVWYGNYNEKQPASPTKTPWAHYVASKFRASGAFVPKPCAVVYPDQDIFDKSGNYRFLDFAGYGNQSPDLSVAAERVLKWDSFFNSLSATGLPPFAQQDPVYGLTRALNGGTYSGAQPDIRDKFESATSSADKVLASVYGTPPWPAPTSVLNSLGVTAASLRYPLTDVKTQFPPFFAFAFQALSKNLSHVIGINSFGTDDGSGGYLYWDTHKQNYERQTLLGHTFWPALGKFIALLKATESPIVPGKTLFDTTNIWVQSEMGRSNIPNQIPDPNADAAGTDHWEDTHAIFLGGRFKRGKVIGGFSPDYKATPIDLVTGGDGKVVASFNHLIATVIKASGVDPAGYMKEPPIDALIDMAL